MSTLPAPVRASSGRRVLFGLRPAAPLVIVDDDGNVSGLEYEIIAAALAVPGHRLVPYFGTNARLTQALFRAAVDAIAPAVALDGTQFTLTDPYLDYLNVAITLRSRNLRIAGLDDLAGLHVVAFQRARRSLGPAFDRAMDSAASYREEGQQYRQALALQHGRADVVIGDRRILVHQLLQSQPSPDGPRNFQVHVLFPGQEYGVAFRDPAMAADFNHGLATIRADGTYRRIVDHYVLPD